METLLFIMLFFLPTFWLLNSIPNLELLKEFHISSCFCSSPPWIWGNWWYADFPANLLSHRNAKKCKGITKLQDMSYWEQVFWATGDDEWLRNFSAPNSKVWVAERMLHLLWITNPAVHCASAQFRDTGWSFRDEHATAGNHTMNVQLCSFHCVWNGKLHMS